MAWTLSGNIKGAPGSGSGGISIGTTTRTSAYTTTLGDANTYIPVAPSSGSGCSITVPTNASVAYPLGTVLGAFQTNGNAVSLAPIAGVTFIGLAHPVSSIDGTLLTAVKVATNTWMAAASFMGITVNGASPDGYGRIAVSTLGCSATAASGAMTINLAGSNLFYTVSGGLTGNITGITLMSVPGLYSGQTFAHRFLQDSTGGRTVTFPSSFKFVAGSDTTIQSAANSRTLLVATTFDQGTRWECVMRACG